MSTKYKNVNLAQYRAIRKRFNITARGPSPGMVHVFETGDCGTLQFQNSGYTDNFQRMISWDGNNAYMARALATIFKGNTEDFMVSPI